MDRAMRILKIILLCCAVLGLFAQVCAAEKLVMVNRGKPNAVIVVDKDAPAMVQFAAKELQTYIEKVSGANLEIANQKPARGNVIYVGRSKYTDDLYLSTIGFEPDQFRIVTGKGWIALYGREKEPSHHHIHPFRYTSAFDPKTGISRFGETGALYAVYNFLETQCRVRWYMPDELGEIVPKSKTIAVVEMDYTKAPDFPYRHVYWNEMNLGGEENLWMRRVGYGAPEPVVITHSFNLLNKYKDEHPEYFALYNGERDFNITCLGHGNLCLSNQGTLEAFIKEADIFFRDHPSLKVFPVMPNDGWVHICECDDCQKQIDKTLDYTEMYSDYLWNFVNKVAIAVEKRHPDKYIGCCAYSRYTAPPKSIEKLNPNIVVMICKTRLAYNSSEYKAQINGMIDEWRVKANTLYIWEYYLHALGYNLSLRGLPVFFPSIMAEDLRYLKGSSRGEFLESESWDMDSSEEWSMHRKALASPIFYITGKLLWDVNQNPQRMMDQYCRDMYGRGARDLRKFWSEAEKLWMSTDPEIKKLIDPNVFTKEAVNALVAHIERGHAKTAPGSVERKRIEALMADMKPAVDRVNNPLVMGLPRIDVPYTTAAPVIDGTADDEAWKNAAEISFIGRLGETVEHGTKGMLMWDQDNLYLAFVNEEPNPKGMTLKRSGHDANEMWDDEVIELFFRQETDEPKEYRQFIINATANIWDCHWITGDERPEEWDAGATAKSSTKDNAWVLEVSIPLKALGVEKPEDTTLRGNLYRSRNNEDSSVSARSCWSPNLSAGFNAPHRMGYITLKK